MESEKGSHPRTGGAKGSCGAPVRRDIMAEKFVINFSALSLPETLFYKIQDARRRGIA
jgi:hypothetical protein